LVNVFDPAQLLLGEGGLMSHVHDVHGDRPWRALLKNTAAVGRRPEGPKRPSSSAEREEPSCLRDDK
jgi:hypothetical protein